MADQEGPARHDMLTPLAQLLVVSHLAWLAPVPEVSRPVAAPPVPPAAHPLPDAGGAALYEMRLLGGVIAHPEIHLSPVTVMKDGARVRTLRIVGDTEGVFSNIYPFKNAYAAVMDATTLRPYRTQIKMLRGDTWSTIRLTYKDGHVAVVKETDGKKARERKAVAPGSTDGVCWILWLQGLDLAQGESASVTMYTGTYHMRLTATYEGEDEVAVPAGTYKAARWRCVLRLWQPDPPLPLGAPPAAPGKQIDEATVWLSHDAFHIPVKLLLNVAIVGDITLELAQIKAQSL